MQVEAIYHQGQIQFKQPIRFKYEGFSITVILPEEAVVLQTESIKTANNASEAASSLLESIKSILGKHYHLRPAVSPRQDRENLLEALEEKYL